MGVYHSKAFSFTITLPEEWIAEEDGTILSVYDAVNGAGALQFSSYEVKNSAQVNLKDELTDYIKERHYLFVVTDSSQYAYCKCDDRESNQWQYWVFLKGSNLIFASYNCLTEDIGKEDLIVKAIVESALKNAQMNPA